MKLKAFYQNEEKEWVKIDRHQLLAKTESNKKVFKDETMPWFVSTSTLSPKLTFNARQKTFRFMPKQRISGLNKYKGMTITHFLAQEVLSEMKYMKLFLNDDTVNPPKKLYWNITRDSSFMEHYLETESGHFADVFVNFSKDPELALQWDGSFALEVFVSHEVDGAKISEFRQKNIPLIEVKIPKKYIIRKSVDEISKEEEKVIKDKLWEHFKKGINGNLLSKPNITEHLENEIVKKKEDKIHRLTERHNDLEKKISKLQQENEALINKNSLLNKKLSLAYQSYGELKEELNASQKKLTEFNNKSKFKKVLKILLSDPK